MTIYWIPGWQFDAAAFAPIFSALPGNDAKVLNYADSNLTRQHWLAEQAELLDEGCAVVGWSLGGMLACELAALTNKVKQVVVLNANTRFAGGPGLEPAVADSFMQRYQRNPELTRKRFAALVDADAPEQMQQLMLAGDRQNTLQWLYDIDLQDTVLTCPVLVLLSTDDRLVPVQTAEQSWQQLAADVTVLPGQHSAPFSQPERLAQWLQQRGVVCG